MISSNDTCFISFNESIDSYSLPKLFTYPFNYEPHQLCRLAAKELQLYLETQTDWHHDFGIEQEIEGTNIGKMFGILLVRNQQNEIGYVAAFSGKLAGGNNHQKFVPPIVDLLHEDGFYRKGEVEISKINHRITAIETSAEYVQCKKEFDAINQQATSELDCFRKNMKIAKQQRDVCRAKFQHEYDSQEFEYLKEKLKNESLHLQYDYKLLDKYWKERFDEYKSKLDMFTNEVYQLKEERRTKSAALQQRMFHQYQFLNSQGDTKNVCEIFSQTGQKVPPAGAGDCAAPKLLQYAYQHHLKPLAMAEFWWGQSPKSEIRKHGSFYPSCRGKCEPILHFMLHGLDVDKNPVLEQLSFIQEPEIVFEDANIIVINKPTEYLSVPGKTKADSVYSFIKRTFPEVTGPVIVHRLDMSTSGLMVIAKDMKTYHSLQLQFLYKSVKKRYIALLEGKVTEDEGTINLPLRVDFDNRPHQMICYEYGKRAVTTWKVLERLHNRTRIQFMPSTGRTHQLRVHAAHLLGLNCPIVGDDLYGKRANRLHLHAEFLEFIHPQTNNVVSFQVNAPF